MWKTKYCEESIVFNISEGPKMFWVNQILLSIDLHRHLKASWVSQKHTFQKQHQLALNYSG